MSDNYYIGETINYPAESVNFIVDLWRDFTNGDAFPINETEFPRMDEFIVYLQNQGHFERLQGRWQFSNLSNMPYFWEFILSPVHTVPIDGQDDIVVAGAEVLLSPEDFGPGFEGFVRSLLYHMMNKHWINESMTVPGSGLELSTDVFFRARLLRFDGIQCSSNAVIDNCGKQYKIKCMATSLKSVERKVMRLKDVDFDFYKLLIFDIPRRNKYDLEFCVYKILKLIDPEVSAIYNREYRDYEDVANTCKMLLKENNWSLFHIEEDGDYWKIINSFENVHQKYSCAFLIFIMGQHARVTCIQRNEKRGTEYLMEKCNKCEKHVRLNVLHFDKCFKKAPASIGIGEVALKSYSIDDVINMDEITNATISSCIKTLRAKHSVYINGPGGSGKSRLIRRIQQEFDVQILAVPAEVARSFIGGRTASSFFKLEQIKRKFHKGLRDLYENHFVDYLKFINDNFPSCPEYVVIDESGMLDGLEVDTIDLICRGITQNFTRHFGNIKMIFVLDETQLPAIGGTVPLTTVEAINHIRCIEKKVFTLSSPWRLREGIIDEPGTIEQYEELLSQFKYLESIRFGIDPGIKFINFEDEENFNFRNIEGVILVRWNKHARKLIKKIYADKSFTKVWEGNPFECFLGMSVICTSNISRRFGKHKPFNGERGIVNGITQYQGETVVCVKFEKGECMFRNYVNDEKKQDVDLVCGKVITIHRSQGMTIRGNIYIEWFEEGAVFHDGMLYVAMSRCINLKNVTVIKKRARKIGNFFKKSLKFSRLATAVANEPTKILPLNLIEKKNGHYANYSPEKQRATFSFKDKRYFKPREVKVSKMLHDYKFGEYSRIFDHSIIIDHETAKEGVSSQHHVVCTFVKYYVNGKPRHFNELLWDYGKIPEHSDPASERLPKYKWDSEFEMMEFSLDYSDRPIQEICLGICMILEMKAVYITHKKGINADWMCLLSNPMTDWGFNNNGFDVFFFFKEYLECSKWSYYPELINAGTQLKCFKLTHKGATLYETRDLMQLTGPGNFANATDSWCKNIKIDLLNGENLEKYMSPFMPDSFEHYCKVRNESIIIGESHCDKFTKDDMQKDYELYLSKRLCEYENLKKLSEQIQHYKSGNDVTKGFAPLKLIVDVWGRSAERWKRMPAFMNLIAEYGREHFIDVCFFPREHAAVIKTLSTPQGLAFYQNYNLRREFKNYARLDVFLTELLMRAMNDVVYKFGATINMRNGESVSIGSSIKDINITGTRTSLLRYSTTANLVQQISFTNLPGCCLAKSTGNIIETELHLLPKNYDHLINGVLGGKTLGRRLHYQSNGDSDDYMQYLDFSGMYMKILEKYEYPYGPYNHITNEEHPNEISRLMKSYENKDEKLFTKCAIFRVKVKAHEKEIEPLYGLKRNGKAIQYTIKGESVYATNYEMRVFSDYDVKLLEIKECLYWESQTPMFKNVMKYYAELKNSAELAGDKVGRTFAKLMANSTFGTMAKSDKDECTMVWSTPKELLEIFKQYPACGKFLKAPVIRGKFHMAKIKTNEGMVNSNIPYIGRFTLGASKIMLYDAIRIGYGDDRFSDENFENMIAYGDTDSITMHRKCIERLIEHDKSKDEVDQILFYTNGNANLKAGKLTDELLDDVDKYFKDGEYVKAIKAVNKDWNNVANLRIVEIFNPAAKSGGVKFKVPAFGYNGVWYEERFGYKNFCKGIPSSARVYIDEKDVPGNLKAPSDIAKIGHNVETYELFKFAYQYLIPLTSQRQDVLKKVIFPNSTEMADSIQPMDINSFSEGSKNAWGNTGKLLLEENYIVDENSKKKRHKSIEISDWVGEKRRLITRENIEKVKRGELTMFDISSGQKLWHHFQN